MNATMLKQIVETALSGAHVQVTDLTGTHDHFQMMVVSPAFEGKPQLERHRLVYAILQGEMQSAIHALSIQALTPQEAQQSKT